MRGAVSDEWPAEGFEHALLAQDRVVVLFFAEWCSFSRIFVRDFDAAEPESSVPFGRANLHHPMDPRWDDHRVHTVPTCVYFERGEELERVEAARGRGLDHKAFQRFLEDVEALQEQWRYRHGRLQLDRTG